MSKREQVLLEKQQKIEHLSSELKESDAIFFTEYRGLTVGQLQEFRSSLREVDASYYVIKNTLIKRSFSSMNIQCPDDVFKGPTALIVSKQDCPVVASKLFKFLKANDAMVVKGGYLDGGFISQDDVKSLSKLPSRDVLIGQLVGGLKSTISRFVMGVGSPIRGLVYSLEAIKNKKN
ncbi:MAG: 50S ribosomal protein L10 [Candidatus Margulisiibacteriota bacterium]